MSVYYFKNVKNRILRWIFLKTIPIFLKKITLIYSGSEAKLYHVLILKKIYFLTLHRIRKIRVRLITLYFQACTS